MMEKFRKSRTVLLYVLLVAFISSCGNEEIPEPDVQELAFERLSGSWSLGTDGSITVDNVDVSSLYSRFSLMFSQSTFQTLNGSSLFEASGTWEWIDQDANSIRLSDGKEITIETLREDRFVFSFFNSDGPVRAGVSGNYIVTLNK